MDLPPTPIGTYWLMLLKKAWISLFPEGEGILAMIIDFAFVSHSIWNGLLGPMIVEDGLLVGSIQ